MRTRRFLLCLLLAATTLPAMALDRPFPLNAMRGKMTVTQYPDILINDKVARLSHTVRIWNADNRLGRSSQLAGKGIVINFTENNKGEVDRIWILNAEEARSPLSTQRVSQAR